MNKKDSHLRRQIFREELRHLKEKQYIDELDYQRIRYAYQLYLDDEDTLEIQSDSDLQQQKPIKKNPKPIKTKNRSNS